MLLIIPKFPLQVCQQIVFYWSLYHKFNTFYLLIRINLIKQNIIFYTQNDSDKILMTSED